MDAVTETGGVTATRAAMSARVLADARRSFAAGIDEAALVIQVEQVVDDLWTASTTVTAFIPVLALRDLRERIESRHEPRGA